MKSISSRSLEVCDILQNLINIEGLTVAELARKINLPQPTIQRIVSGAYKQPRTSTLEPIATYFNLTVNQLRGLMPISSSLNKKNITSLPLLTIEQATNWSLPYEKFSQFVVCDNELGKKSFAMIMPDKSMEPGIIKGATLLVDPTRVPNHGNFVVVKLASHPNVIVRQLITNTCDTFIKPLSSDLHNLDIIQLKEQDTIRGVIVEIRFCCE